MCLRGSKTGSPTEADCCSATVLSVQFSRSTKCAEHKMCVDESAELAGS